MSSETFYSPELTLEKSQEVIDECNKIIAEAVAEKLRIISLAEIKNHKYVPESINNQTEWENVGGSYFSGEIKRPINVKGDVKYEKRATINDSNLVKHDVSEYESRLSSCIPRTNEDLLEKRRLLNRLYSEDVNIGARLKREIGNFCDTQEQLSDIEKETIARYKVLQTLVKCKNDTVTVEEMKNNIPELENKYFEVSKKKYIDRVVSEVFQKLGYQFIDDDTKYENACMVLPNGGKIPVNCYLSGVGNGFLLESIAITNCSIDLSNDDKNEVIAEQKEICKKNKIIEELCLEQGIVLKKFNEVIPTKENVVYKNINTARRRHNSIGKNKEWKK